ncbi:zinc-ribbon domain-containing protein [Levilinea saccharolytica]|nr:zinc ribbon domain-containing protein [Levilinea saccharolytica]GAP18535.1 protein containing zinc-ribbon domain [Levilinea saccharolytica]
MVMGLFSIDCPHCGKPVNRNAAYCSHCGEPLASGKKICGACGTQNRGEASFCAECGRPLSESAAPEMSHQRWARREEDFAVRVEANDLPGLLNKGLMVDPGTNALLVSRGENLGLVPPGSYKIENVLQKGWDILKGDIPHSVTALLVDITPTDLLINLGGRYTRDPLPVGMSLRLVVEVNEPAKFLINILKGRERYGKEDLRAYLYPEVAQVADRWLREHSLSELAEDASLCTQLDLALEQSLKRTFAQSGLRFLQTRTVELNLEPYDEVKGIRGKYALLNMRTSAELEGMRLAAGSEEEKRRFEEEARIRKAEEETAFRERWQALQHREDLNALAAETEKVQIHEQRIALFQRMREASLSDKINEVRSEHDFELFLDSIDLDKLLKAREREELKQGWLEQDQDHIRERAYLITKAEIEHNFSLRAMQLNFQHAEDVQKLNNELEIARKRSDYEFELRLRVVEEEIKLELKRIEIEKAKQQIEEDRRKRAIELAQFQRRAEREEDEADAMMGMRLLGQMKEMRRKDEEDTNRIRRLDEEERLRIHRVDELERKRAELQMLLERMEVEERLRQNERIHMLKTQESEQEYQLRRLAEIGKLGPEALIAISGTEQGRILADLKKTEALKGMSEEQILAMAAENSPEVAKAFQEKFRAIAEGRTSAEVKEMYERLVHEKDEAARRAQEEADKRAEDIKEAWEKSSDQSRQTTERAMDNITRVAESFARSQGQQTPTQPIIITPGQAPQVIHSVGGGVTAQNGTDGRKVCVNCGQSAPVDAKFCEKCGNEFKGM